MKALRAILLIGGLALIVWGILSYFSEIPTELDQALPKIILGILAILASFLAKNRR